MPLGNDSRASRRPMPRQLDMSGWSGDSYGDRASRRSRDADEVNYRNMREASNRYESSRENDHPRRPLPREESQHPFETKSSRTSDFDISSISSGRSTVGGSTLSSNFTSIGSGRYQPRGDRASRQDNQREADDFIRSDSTRSSRWDEHTEPRRSDRRSQDRFQRAHASDSSAYAGAAESFNSNTSLRYEQAESIRSNDKADSIRGPESPVPARRAKSSRDDGELPEIGTSLLPSGFDNQDEHHLSRTNSETSIAPAFPESEYDSDTKRNRDRNSKLSISSPILSDRSRDRRFVSSSPCSPASVKSTTASRKASRSTQSAMSDLRENLYAFRKQMREIFIRVEDMVDVHRSFFKSDPSTGKPVFREELQQEAEKLANETFEQLADLREHFVRLAKDFQRSETDEQPLPRRTRFPSPEASSRSKRSLHNGSSRSSDDENNSVKHSDHPEDDGSERLSVASENNDEASSMELSPSIRQSTQSSDDDFPTVSESIASTKLSSRWRKNSSRDSESIAMSDISARTKTRAPSIVSDSSSRHDQCSKSEPDADSIFKDFDKRMEQIRCSLNAIANGRTPINHQGNTSSVATPPKNFTVGGAGSPIRAMMDVTRTRPTPLEAPGISRRLGEDDSRPRPGGREAELRHLLRELNHINSSNEDEED
ncbi:hypothetical protein L914_12118 [Phytophthora nicotianae]|uniref:Uncharacterized protein n=1 Tax=Phytophthora nicotianae TaxID=4792 RepID=W2N2S8_PHYNI|nr:hypothetical protein L914_12118 [Phytophthora nicotianae]